MKTKFRLTEETIEVFDYSRNTTVKLHRIQALVSFGNVMEGDMGGFVEHECNLENSGNAWVYGNTKVYGNAKVCGNAWVCGNAEVCGDAKVYGNAKVCGNACVCGNAEVCGDAKVYGNAWVYGNAEVCGDAKVYGNADYIVFKNWWSSGRFFTWTRSNNMWRVGCFYGTGEELIEKAYGDSELSGREYERIVKYVEEILKQ